MIMALHLVTGYKGTAHITSADQGAFNAALIGTEDYVCKTGRQFEAQIMTNNSVRIYDGDLLMQGRHVNLKVDTYEDVTIENGAQGMNRNDLIVCRYAKDATSGQEAALFVVLKGTPTEGTASDPAVTSGDILGGAILHEMPLYRVKIEGLSIVAIEKLYSMVSPVVDVVTQEDMEAYAFPLTGGIVNGDMRVGGGYMRFDGASSSSSIYHYPEKTANNWLRVMLSKSGNTPIVRMLSALDGKTETFNLYGEHNKPTASDVGAMAFPTNAVTGSLAEFCKSLKVYDSGMVGYYSVSDSPSNIAVGYLVYSKHNTIGSSVHCFAFYMGKAKFGYYDAASDKMVWVNGFDNYLPLTGGTVKELIIARSGNQSYIQYKGNNANVGYIGFDGANNPVFINADATNIYKLYGEHNITCGTTEPTSLATGCIYEMYE